MMGMILAAGLGTRLAPLTDKTPKPLIEIGGEPLIVRQILQLKEGGVSDIVINLHHLGEMIFIESAMGVNTEFKSNTPGKNPFWRQEAG